MLVGGVGGGGDGDGDGVGFSLLLVACNCFAVVFFASNFRHTYSHSP